MFRRVCTLDSSCQPSNFLNLQEEIYIWSFYFSPYNFFDPCFLLWLFSFNMGLKVPHIICFILWLSLLVLLFQEFKFLKTNRKSIAYSPSNNHPLFTQRKALIASNFDFTPFVKNRHHHHRKHSPVDVHERPEPAGSEIDPRYGVEKRLVPTGPNPLHH